MTDAAPPQGKEPNAALSDGPVRHAEVRIETIRMICEVHRRSLPSNLIAWSVMACASLSLSNSTAFILPLIMRLVSIGLNDRGWEQLRAQLAANDSVVPDTRILNLCMLLCGASWALVLQPMFCMEGLDVANVAIMATVALGMSLIITVIAPLRLAALSLTCGFSGILLIELLVGDAPLGSAHLLLGGTLIGLIAFNIAAARQKLMFAETLVDKRHLQAGLTRALEKAEYLATRDPLTGLLNRRAFFDEYEQLPNSLQSQLHLLTIDLDHFKLINDSYGHDVGDKVLIAAAAEIRGLLKVLPANGHQACRFGGEEFVVLTSELDNATVRAIGETLRRRLHRIPALFEMDDKLNVSASIGIARMEHGETIDDALRRSDLAMYRAKDRGRDRVELAA